MPFHVLANKLVGTHDDVNAPSLQVLEHLPCLLGRACPRQIVHPDGEVAQTVAERLVMLQRKHRGRHEDRHLL